MSFDRLMWMLIHFWHNRSRKARVFCLIPTGTRSGQVGQSFPGSQIAPPDQLATVFLPGRSGHAAGDMIFTRDASGVGPGVPSLPPDMSNLILPMEPRQ